MNGFSLFWFSAGLLSLWLFWAVCGSLILSVRQKRVRLFLPGLLLLAVLYIILQCISTHVCPTDCTPDELALADRFAAFPRWGIILLFAGTGAAVCLLLVFQVRYERTHITSVSVKAAVDSVPAGICVYLDGGRILMINRAMEALWETVSGELPFSGERMSGRLFSGDLLSGCGTGWIGETPIILTPDRTAWSLSLEDFAYGGEQAHVLKAEEITELYQKTQSLRTLQDTLTALNSRLVAYNAEIVTLTAETELLDARVRLHDEMGADLLSIRQYIQNGGTERDRAKIEERLRRDVSFLLTGQTAAARDEYELMTETAGQLGVTISVSGTLPQTEPQKHVIAAAIHECMTNTLRHAHGDALNIAVQSSGDRIEVRFSNNGVQPAEMIREQGGLAYLRSLVEKIPDGRMEIAVSPAFVLTVTLPKEVPYGI